MSKLTNQEIQFLIDISKEQMNTRYHKDITTENTKVHTVDVYFIIDKLEKQLDK